MIYIYQFFVKHKDNNYIFNYIVTQYNNYYSDYNSIKLSNDI